MCTLNTDQTGANPINIQWKVVRGDTAQINIEFLENDEYTHFNTQNWQYKATAYDPSGDFLDTLQTSFSDNILTITALPAVTQNWGTSYSSVVAELTFDVQVKMGTSNNSQIWTPVIGTICVFGDVSPRGSL